MDGVVTVVQSGGQYQVVIGQMVGDVYDEILQYQGIKGAGAAEAEEDDAPKKPLDIFIDTVSGIFTPVLGVLAACGRLSMVIYVLKNKINGKQYVGQTTRNLKQRIAEHKSSKDTCIGQAIHKYGLENFEISIIEKCKTIEELNEREIFLIENI